MTSLKEQIAWIKGKSEQSLANSYKPANASDFVNGQNNGEIILARYAIQIIQAQQEIIDDHQKVFTALMDSTSPAVVKLAKGILERTNKLLGE